MQPADYLLLAAAFISFLFSIYLWFQGQREEGLFVGLWVPSILAFYGLVRRDLRRLLGRSSFGYESVKDGTTAISSAAFSTMRPKQRGSPPRWWCGARRTLPDVAVAKQQRGERR